jgi:RNA ligase (TIGR02306 family)
MSSLIVEVCRVDDVQVHPNADRMCVCTVKGWQVCASRDPETLLNEYKPGDKCIYIPPDSILPPELSDRLGCTKYLSPLPKNNDGVRPPGGRVRVARLRSVPSYGLIMHVEDDSLSFGTDVAALYGITKWEPPPEVIDGDAERPHPAFPAYTDIENYRNFPDLIIDGEEVVLTEKLHGMNCRLGILRTENGEWEFAAGSHGQRRKEIDAKGRRSKFWEVMTDPIREMLHHVATTTPNAFGVVVYGELFGSGIQDMWYGMENGRFSFRAFDLAINGRYVDYDLKVELFRRFGVEQVPILWRGPFSRTVLEEHINGPTTMCAVEKAGKFKGREGVVVTPTREREGAANGKEFSRVILKGISFEYLERKGGTEFH